MRTFDKWNLLLLQEYFAPEQQDAVVFFDTTSEKLDELGPVLGGSEGLLAAARCGPAWNCGVSLQERMTRQIAQRTASHNRPPGYVNPGRQDNCYWSTEIAQSAPTFLPYLAALVCVWSRDQHEGGFYANLRKALGLPDGWGPTQMQAVSQGWEDLQRWTNSTSGRFGRFRLTQLGQHPYVGQLRSQVLLSKRDFEALGGLFAECKFEPRSEPTDTQLAQLIQRASEQNGLSVGFTGAAQKSAFHGLLRQVLAEAALEWDGSREGEDVVAGGLSPRLGLTLGAGDALPWRLALSFPSEQLDADCEECFVALGETKLPAMYEAGIGTVCRDARLADALGTSSAWDGSLVVDGLRREIRHPHQLLLWILSGQRGIHGQFELWECALPSHGNAYLLASEQGAAGLDGYLDREQPQWQEVPCEGLPNGWRLIYLAEQALTDGQRCLPDGKPVHRRLHPIRFEKGVSIRRNRKRYYLAYDLPEVLLDAPAGTEIRCSGTALDGKSLVDVRLEAMSVPDAPGGDSNLGARLGARRFVLPDAVEAGGTFMLRALRDGDEVASALIRVDGADTPTVIATAEHALDCTGRMQSDAKGLWGALDPSLIEGTLAMCKSFEIDAAGWHSTVDFEGYFKATPGARFLDALSGTGSMVWARARDLASRLLSSAKLDARPTLLVEDLWRRGHLEVERNSRGHYVRVHAVPRAAYALPVSKEGARLHGVLGTLSLNDWRTLCSAGSEGIFVQCNASTFMPALRLCAFDNGALRRFLGESEIALLPFQGLDIARWSADTATMLRRLSAARFEVPPERPHELRSFNVRTGRWKACTTIRRIGKADQDIVVYQMVDPRTEVHRLHVIAMREGFAFAWGQRWAVWMALESFFTYLKSLQGCEDFGQWPMPYEERKGDLWLPRALRLPTVLERAAVCCAGAPPEEYEMVGEEVGNEISLKLKQSGLEVIRLPMEYQGYATGTWLRYQFVPHEVLCAIQN